MRKMARNLVIGLAIVGCLGLPLAASAVTYEDSFTNCNYPKTFDLMIMRPLSFVTMVTGAALFVPMGMLALLTVPEDVGTVYGNLVGSPAAFTFDRRLGECQAVDLSL